MVPLIRDRVARSGIGSGLPSTHVFVDAAEVPDDFQLKLVVLSPDAPYTRNGASLAQDRAETILRTRGEAPRLKQNRLLFLVADNDHLSRLREQARSMLAWQSIVTDVRDGRLNLDQNQARQASKSLDDANEAVRRMVRETYRWLLVPHQEARPGKGISPLQWETYPLNPSAQNAGQEFERVLAENELVIVRWAPVHLAQVLREFYWKEGVPGVSAARVWRDTCQYLYLPRLKDDTVFQTTVGLGVEAREFFGMAQAESQDGRWPGFVFGQRSTVFMDDHLQLIQPAEAERFDLLLREEEAARNRPRGRDDEGKPGPGPGPQPDPTPPPPPPARQLRRFYGSVDLDPVQAKRAFADVVEEVVAQFTRNPDVRVRITVEVEATADASFDEAVRRAVSENCRQLGFGSAEFEAGD